MIILGILIAAVLIAAVLAFTAAALFRRVVPTNMVHIIQSRKSTISYGKGNDAGNTYYAWPSWIPAIGVTVTEMPESVFDVSLTNYEAYDIGRLPFIVDIRAFFRIEKSDVAAHRVSTFAELRDQLTAVLQGAVRRILSTNNLESIMQDRSSLGDQFTKEVNDQLKEWGVQTVKSIEFMDIRDARESKVIHNMMAKEQSRIEKESRITVASNQREAMNAEIDAQRTVDINKQEALQQVGLRTAEKDKAVGIANEKARQEIQAEAKVTTERAMEVQKVQNVRQAEIEREVLVVTAEAQKKAQIVQAEGQKQSQVELAEGQRQVTMLKAEGNLAATLKEAEGIAATGNAKAEAEKALQLAPVAAQITLAKEIGENKSYQEYLVTIRRVEAEQAVGVQMAEALKDADMKVIANGGSVQSGVSNLMDLFSSKGGTAITGMLSALGQSPEGKALVDTVTKASK